MYRQANSASRELRHLKQARAKTATLPELSDRGERAEHLTTVLLAEGLSNPPAPVKLIEPSPDESTPLIVSSSDTESLFTKTEIPPRQTAPAVAAPSRTATPAVSSHDPESRHTKTETPARLRHPINLPPDHPDANLVGAWRLAHLFPAPADD